ncbi:hypothetical protein BC629DRAFT_1524371 [Irpex lacteus]|nr:hypothetical protein BC629DRAFT_1524371 [Irpex lacteus]
MDRDALSPSQQEALSQLQALTNGGDADVAMSVLDSVGWDVQRAADVIFDNKPSAPLSISQPSTSSDSSSRSQRHVEDFDRPSDGRPTGRQFDRVIPTTSALSILLRPLRFILALLAVPYTILRLSCVHFESQYPYRLWLGLNFGLPHRPSIGGAPPVRDAKVAAERWARSLEEETGCVSISRAQVTEGESSGVASGSASVTRRNAGAQLRDFVRTLAKEDQAKVGCVIIVSEEHDDTPEFKRSTLTDPEFVRLMKDNDFLVWGGDIRDRDAWSAAQKLQATTYHSTQTSQSSVLTVLSRHQGPSIPAASGPTSAQTLVKHLNEQLIPRVSPYLAGLRRQAADRETARLVEQQARQRERALRAEQDRAFEETARRDKERIERKIAEEREQQRAAVRQAEETQRELEEQQRVEDEKAAWEAKRMEWRRWGRRALLPREPRPGEQGRGKTVRVGVRMPNGKRPVRFFGENDSLTAVYAFVDAQFIPEGMEYPSTSDPTSAPDGEENGGKKNGHWWGFKLAMAYPRREIHWEPGKKLVVELFEDPSSSTSKAKSRSRSSLESTRPGSSGATSPTSGGDSDEYETESD